MRKVLVADDDPGICAVIRLALDENFKVVAVSDGDQALDELKRDSSYACVVLDMEMPKMSGIAVFKMMREVAALKNIPVIILTGNGDMRMQVDALTQGVMTYFHKPFVPSQLHTMVTMVTAISG